MANKADKTQPPIYRTWCPDAGQSSVKGYLELGAIDAANAARIHAQRMTDRDWNAAKKGARGEDPYVKILVYCDEGAGRTDHFTVRRRMEPVFEVIA